MEHPDKCSRVHLGSGAKHARAVSGIIGCFSNGGKHLDRQGDPSLNRKLPDEDFAEAVRIFQAAFDKHQPDGFVGSSRGGAVAMSIKSGEARHFDPFSEADREGRGGRQTG